jgi:hypothetical protein
MCSLQVRDNIAERREIKSNKLVLTYLQARMRVLGNKVNSHRILEVGQKESLHKVAFQVDVR